MEVEIVKSEKNLLEIKVDSIVVAEILRVYLNRQGIEFVAWRIEHPTKPVFFRIESKGKGVKKEINDAVSAIKKDLSKVGALIKK
jgi:DNA-directed RNA polymerase subunit L